MKRVLLLLATNLAILIVLSITWRILDSIFGISQLLIAACIPANFGFVALMALVMGFGGAFISLLLSKSMAKSSMGVHIIDTPTNQDERWLLDTVHRQAQQAGIGMPEVGIFQSAQPNAFATGANKNNALVAVSTGLLQHMTHDEVEAVLGHEVSHIANGDMVTQTLLQGVLNTFVIFFARVIGYLVDRLLSGNNNNQSFGMGYFIASMIAEILLGFLATAIVMWFSRRREFAADRGGADLSTNQKMINALRRLQYANQPEDLPGEMAAFGINGGLGEGLKKIFLSHPPLEERIQALENYR
ncbi:MAG: protease HtpX [bacterium]